MSSTSSRESSAPLLDGEQLCSMLFKDVTDKDAIDGYVSNMQELMLDDQLMVFITSGIVRRVADNTTKEADWFMVEVRPHEVQGYGADFEHMMEESLRVLAGKKRKYRPSTATKGKKIVCSDVGGRKYFVTNERFGKIIVELLYSCPGKHVAQLFFATEDES